MKFKFWKTTVRKNTPPEEGWSHELHEVVTHAANNKVARAKSLFKVGSEGSTVLSTERITPKSESEEHKTL